MRAHLRRCLYTADLQKRLTHTVTHTVTHTRKRADGSSGNRDVKEYFNSSENDQKRLENNIFRIFLLFVISRSGVRIRPPAPSEYGGFPEWPKGTDCKSAGNAFGGSNPPSPTKYSRRSFDRRGYFFDGDRWSRSLCPAGVNPPSPSKMPIAHLRGRYFYFPLPIPLRPSRRSGSPLFRKPVFLLTRTAYHKNLVMSSLFSQVSC